MKSGENVDPVVAATFVVGTFVVIIDVGESNLSIDGSLIFNLPILILIDPIKVEFGEET
jgi:hypothetical protein